MPKPPIPAINAKPYKLLKNNSTADFSSKHVASDFNNGLIAMSRLKTSASVNSVILTSGGTNFRDQFANALGNNSDSFSFWCENLMMADTLNVVYGEGSVTVHFNDQWKIYHLHSSIITRTRVSKSLGEASGAQHVVFDDSD